MDEKSFGKTSILSLQNLPKLARIVMAGKYNFRKLEVLHLENIGNKEVDVEIDCKENRQSTGLKWDIRGYVSEKTINSFKKWLMGQEEE